MADKLCMDCGVVPIAVQALRCKECKRLHLNAKAREYGKRAYAENPDKFKARSSEYYQANRERVIKQHSEDPRIREYNRVYMPEYYLRNKAKIDAQNQANYYANIEARKASNRRYRESNRDRVLAQKRAYYWANRDVLLAKFAEYVRNNPDGARRRNQRRRAVKMGAIGKHTEAEWRAIIESQKGRCAHCGQKRKLEKDHRIPLSRGGSDYAYNIQGLCRSCNAKKADKIEYGDQHSLFDRLDKAA